MTAENARDDITPEEFVKRMPEGEGAGPGAPETEEPVQGRPGAGGHGPGDGPGGPAPEGMGDAPPEGARRGEGDAEPEAGGAAASAVREGVAEAGRLARKAGGKDAGGG